MVPVFIMHMPRVVFKQPPNLSHCLTTPSFPPHFTPHITPHPLQTADDFFDRIIRYKQTCMTDKLFQIVQSDSDLVLSFGEFVEVSEL